MGRTLITLILITDDLQKETWLKSVFQVVVPYFFNSGRQQRSRRSNLHLSSFLIFEGYLKK